MEQLPFHFWLGNSVKVGACSTKSCFERTNQLMKDDWLSIN